MIETPHIRMTSTEFLAMSEAMLPSELIDGGIILNPSPNPKHQAMIGDIYTTLRHAAKFRGGVAYLSPLLVYFDKENVVQPDVMWIAPNSRCTVGDKYLCGAPDLVVEVLSSGSTRRDKVTKFRLYDQAGVHEYWVIDPVAHYIEVFVRLEGQFQLLGVFEAGDVFLSVILKGYEIQVAELFPHHEN